jgi:hypothetical protein
VRGLRSHPVRNSGHAHYHRDRRPEREVVLAAASPLILLSPKPGGEKDKQEKNHRLVSSTPTAFLAFPQNHTSNAQDFSIEQFCLIFFAFEGVISSWPIRLRPMSPFFKTLSIFTNDCRYFKFVVLKVFRLTR